MPSWKKVITSGSDASLNKLTVVSGITGSLQGTASNASQATNVVGSANRILFNTGTNTTTTSNNLTWTDSTNLLTLGDGTGAAGTINKIALYTASYGGYGLGVSPAQLDYVSDGSHVFYKNGVTPTELVRITNGGNVLITGSLDVTNNIIGSLLGTASFAISASYAPPTPAFPFTGSAGISGSLIVDGTIRGKLNRYNYATYRIRTFNIYVGEGFYGIANNPNYPGILVGENEPIYFYVDINDYSNGIEYRELSFATLTEINTFCGDQEIEDGEIVFYSYTNNTDTLRIGGSNTFSTIFGINKNGKDKILSNKKWEINTDALPQLRAYLTSSFMADMSSSIDNFEAEYLNRDQINAICSSTEYVGRVYFDKYKERHLSRFYYRGNFSPSEGGVIGFDGYGALNQTDQHNKLLSTTLCNMNRINDSIFTISTVKPTTTNGTTTGGEYVTKVRGGPGTSLFHVYIFAGSVNNTRILAIEPLSIDALTIPFPFRDSLPTIPNYIYKLKIGQRFADTTLVRNDTNDSYNNLSPRPLVDSITVNLPSSAYGGKQTNIDVIRLYEDKTCDVFKQCARMVHTVYNRKTDSKHLHAYYMKLNK